MCGPQFCSMRITDDVRRYAEEQGLNETDAVAVGMANKAGEFIKAGGEIYLDGAK